MMENQVSSSKANATYQNSSKVKEAAYRIFAAVANAILVVLGGGLLTQTIGNLTGIHVLTLIGGEAQALLAASTIQRIARALRRTGRTSTGT